MATRDFTHPPAVRRLVSGRLARGLGDLLGRLSAWNDARVTRDALRKLSDRQLDDIGLRRGDIDDIAR